MIQFIVGCVVGFYIGAYGVGGRADEEVAAGWLEQQGCITRITSGAINPLNCK